ncbi:MAG: N-acetylmuramoyl-L-alanine amidase, partial [Geminicoccaceae bacterium]|nr:N-acetylmuramoyl-L-alanine amidase [Geminicoccaceae bacterium]
MQALPPVEERASPNRDARPEGAPIDTIVLHYTGMASGAAALARLCDPAAEVSAHYLIERDGRILRLVPEDERAWHAGRSYWAGAERLNDRSIGIELVNPGHAH